MNNLSTVLYKINFKYIIDNCLNKKLWKKSWVIYDYDNFKLYLSLASIQIKDNQLIMRVHSHDDKWNYSSVYIPMSEDHFNENVFYMAVFSAMKNVIDSEERGLIYNTPLYNFARDLDRANDDRNEEVAKAYLDSQKITDEKIRQLYIEKYVDDSQSNYRGETLLKLEKTIHPQRYLMLATQFENLAPAKSQELYDSVKEKIPTNGLQQFMKEISDSWKDVEQEEMENEDDE